MATRKFNIKDEKVLLDDELFCEAEQANFDGWIADQVEAGTRVKDTPITALDREKFVEFRLKRFYLETAKVAHIERARRLAVENADKTNLD